MTEKRREEIRIGKRGRKGGSKEGKGDGIEVGEVKEEDRHPSLRVGRKSRQVKEVGGGPGHEGEGSHEHQWIRRPERGGRTRQGSSRSF